MDNFNCLLEVVTNLDTTNDDLNVAWSELSVSEVDELTGGNGGADRGGKVEFNAEKEFAPLHDAAYYGNLNALEFLLVRLLRKWNIKFQCGICLIFLPLPHFFLPLSAFVRDLLASRRQYLKGN